MMKAQKSRLPAVLLLLAYLIIPTASAEAASDRVSLIENREFVAAMDRDYINFDPHAAVSSEMVQLFTAITEGLFTYHPQTLDPVPAIAQSVDTPDFKHWEITIRDDAAFSSGDPITAETFVESWKALIDPSAEDHTYASLFDIIQGVRDYRLGKISASAADIGFYAEDDRTIVIDLESPAPYLLNMLCHYSFSAIHPDNLRRPNPRDPESFISSGPFTVSSADSTAVRLRKNPHYWDRNRVDLNTIRIQFYTNTWALIRDFQSDSIHWSMKYIDPQFLFSDEVLVGYPEYSTGFFFFSAEEGPYADPRIRQALAYAVPWENIRSSTRFFYPTDHLVPQTESYNGVSGIGKQDLEKSRSVLEAAGYPDGEGLPQLRIAIYPGSMIEDITRTIADTWKNEFGISVIIEVKNYMEYLEQMDSGRYQLQFLSWVGDFFDPYSFLHLWYTSSSFNLGNQYNPIYDRYIDTALREGDSVRRYELFKDAEQYLLDQATVLPVYHGVSMNFIHTELIGGWAPNLLNIHPFKYIFFLQDNEQNGSQQIQTL